MGSEWLELGKIGWEEKSGEKKLGKEKEAVEMWKEEVEDGEL